MSFKRYHLKYGQITELTCVSETEQTLVIEVDGGVRGTVTRRMYKSGAIYETLRAALQALLAETEDAIRLAHQRIDSATAQKEHFEAVLKAETDENLETAWATSKANEIARRVAALETNRQHNSER